MEDKELFNPQTGEKIAPKRPKKFYKDWRFYVYSLIALMLAIVSVSSAVTACAAINAGVGQKEDASYSVAQRKNAKTTTNEGGYDKYTFSVNVEWGSSSSLMVSSYDFDYSTATLTLDSSESVTFTEIGWGACRSYINSAYYNLSVSSDSIKFIVIAGYTRLYGGADNWAWVYYSFKQGVVSTSGYDMQYRTYLKLSPIFSMGIRLEANGDSEASLWTYTGGTRPQTELLTYSKNSVIQYKGTGSNSALTLSFQDTASYYMELGYQNGYTDGNADGYAAGESAGYSFGYSEGLEVGNSNGEANGYANGYAAGLNASNYFKSITANNDLVFFDILANITPYYTDGDGNLYYYRIFSAEVGEDFYYCWLCYYSTSNWTSWDVYLVWCDQSSSSGFTLDFLKNNSLGVWVVPKSNGAFSSIQSYAVYEPSIKTLDNAKVSLVYNVQMMQAYVALDGGRTYGDVYKDGYTTGYQNGYNYGYELGETAGINAAEPEALTTTLVAVFQQPFNQIYRFFNFNILGLNILGLATGLLSVFIIIKVFKKVLK